LNWTEYNLVALSSAVAAIHDRSVGQVDSGCSRNSGPSCKIFDHTSSPMAERVAASAGLSLPGIKRHSSLSVNVWISPTQSATKI
jgi:hypothetical protein